MHALVLVTGLVGLAAGAGLLAGRGLLARAGCAIAPAWAPRRSLGLGLLAAMAILALCRLYQPFYAGGVAGAGLTAALIGSCRCREDGWERPSAWVWPLMFLMVLFCFFSVAAVVVGGVILIAAVRETWRLEWRRVPPLLLPALVGAATVGILGTEMGLLYSEGRPLVALGGAVRPERIEGLLVANIRHHRTRSEAARCEAVSTAALFGRHGVPALRLALEDPARSTRVTATDYLILVCLRARIPAPGLPILLPMLRDSDAAVRVAAARVLGEMGDRQAVPALVLALRDVDAGVRAIDQNALLRSLRAGPAGAGALVPATGRAGGSGDARVEMARAWCDAAERSATPMPERVIRCDVAVGEAAINALRVLGDPRAALALKRIVCDRRHPQRLDALWALSWASPPDALPLLEEALGDADASARWWAVTGLEMAGDERAMRMIRRATHDPDPGVGARAREALDDIAWMRWMRGGA